MGSDPAIQTALAVASLLASAGGTAAQISATQAASTAARNKALFEAAVARRNTLRAEQFARRTEQEKEVEVRRQAKQVKALQARQRTDFAGRGIVVDIDTPADAAADVAELEVLDRKVIEDAFDLRAAEIRNQGANFGIEAQLAELRAGFRPSITGTVLTGAGSLAEKFSTFRRRGLFGGTRVA